MYLETDIPNVKAVEHIGRNLSHPYTGLGDKSLDEYQGKGFMYDLVKNEDSIT